MTAIKVLIADDQELVRAGFRVLVDGAANLSVVAEAGDGVAAAEAAERTHPDVALMDIRMPRLDGISATRRILACSLSSGPGTAPNWSSPPTTPAWPTEAPGHSDLIARRPWTCPSALPSPAVSAAVHRCRKAHQEFGVIPHGCPGPSTPPTKGLADTPRSARPASVTPSRTARPTIGAPAFPAALIPGKSRGTAGRHMRMHARALQLDPVPHDGTKPAATRKSHTTVPPSPATAGKVTG